MGKWKVKELCLLRKNIQINREFKTLLGGQRTGSIAHILWGQSFGIKICSFLQSIP